MAWPLIAAAALGAGLGVRKAGIEKKRAEEHDKFRKAALTYSPWSGMGDPGAYQGGNTDALSGALQGGMSGLMLGQGLQGLGLGASGAPAGIDGGAATGMAGVGEQAAIQNAPLMQNEAIKTNMNMYSNPADMLQPNAIGGMPGQRPRGIYGGMLQGIA